MTKRLPLVAILAPLALAGCSARAENAPAAKSYTLAAAVTPPAPKVNEAGQWTLTITPTPPWVLKVETPFTATLKPSPGVTVDKSSLRAADFVDPKSAAKSLRTGFVASSAGDHVITTELTFFLCTDEICQRQKDSVAVRFAVP